MTQASSYQGPEAGPGLVDVSELPMKELLATDESAFANAVRQILDQAADPKVFSAFSSFLGE